jgi:hypothetical protein
VAVERNTKTKKDGTRSTCASSVRAAHRSTKTGDDRTCHRIRGTKVTVSSPAAPSTTTTTTATTPWAETCFQTEDSVRVGGVRADLLAKYSID